MTRPTFLERLDQRPLLLDGGMGSLLIAMGLESGRAPEHWNFEHPERIASAHSQYVEAGSDVILTNSFGATPLKLAGVGLEGRCAEINRAAVEIARSVAGTSALVAGDMGPTGKLFPPMGETSADELRAAFAEQATALADAGVDLIAIETMYDLREAVAAVEAARETGLPILASLTFDKKKRGFFTIVGDRIGPSLTTLHEAGANVVGFNCSVIPETMLEMVREAAGEISIPIVAQPNAGNPRVTVDGVVYDAEPEPFARDLARIVEAGARVVGGCCGTDPHFIRAARDALDALGGR